MATKRDIEIYRKVAAGMSQTAVAKQFNLSQPSISGIIKKLDRELQQKGELVIKEKEEYPVKFGGFFTTEKQAKHIEQVTADNAGNYSAAMREIINNSISKH